MMVEEDMEVVAVEVLQSSQDLSNSAEVPGDQMHMGVTSVCSLSVMMRAESCSEGYIFHERRQ